MKLTLEQQALALYLPKNTLQYFEVISSTQAGQGIHLTLEEKNDAPLEARHKGMPVLSKGFQDITVTDFPARGQEVKLTFRRRKWQVGEEILKREIDLCAPGTQLEKDFGLFLKEHS
jgi:hypothetical protein